MNTISETAYYCCGVRMLDADSRNSLLHDHFAHRFMDDHGLKVFSLFKHLNKPNMVSTVRARIIDDHLRKLLAEHKDTQIVLLGAGFDSRAFRIAGGNWLEIDEPAIIAKKNKYLPTSMCPNTLKRIPVDFSNSELNKALGCLDVTKKTLFIVEGVLMYLNEHEIHGMVKQLKHHMREHDLIVDFMNAHFIKRYMKDFLREISRFGCSFSFYHENPSALFKDHGYRTKSVTNIVDRALDLKKIFAPRFLVNAIYPHVIDGYSVNWLTISGGITNASPVRSAPGPF